LQAAVYATAYIRLSVHLSVRPSHFGIVSKRENAEGTVDGDEPIRVKLECKEVDPL